MLVTGAAGFLGTRVIKALLANAGGGPPVSRIVAADITPCPIVDSARRPRVPARSPIRTFIRSIVEPDVDVVFHLAAVLSGQSEAEFDLGMRVNLDATRNLLEACRALGTPPRLVFSSTVAVFGADLPDVVPEDSVLQPQSSYGTAKAMTELLVREYSRRGFVDGIAVRLATVTVRPGKPNSALSSFVSGIIREPIAGIDAVCPVPLDTRIVGHLTGRRYRQPDSRRPRAGRRAQGQCDREPSRAERDAGADARQSRARRRQRGAGRECDARSIRTSRASSPRGPARSTTAAPASLGFTSDRDVDDIVRQYMVETLMREY